MSADAAADTAEKPKAKPRKGPATIARAYFTALGEHDRITLVVGPEGGVSPAELARFEHHVRLGPEVLRTSTAGPAALAVLNLRLGRW